MRTRLSGTRQAAETAHGVSVVFRLFPSPASFLTTRKKEGPLIPFTRTF